VIVSIRRGIENLKLCGFLREFVAEVSAYRGQVAISFARQGKKKLTALKETACYYERSAL